MGCIFCEFLAGERQEHRNGYSFETINETAETVSFLSIDFPGEVEGHALVIPREHHPELEDVPPEVLGEMMEHAQQISRALREEHDAVNLLLNNGEAAGQYVHHAHLHIVPRDEGDGIEIESWSDGEMTEDRFIELTRELAERTG